MQERGQSNIQYIKKQYGRETSKTKEGNYFLNWQNLIYKIDLLTNRICKQICKYDVYLLTNILV